MIVRFHRRRGFAARCIGCFAFLNVIALPATSAIAASSAVETGSRPAFSFGAFKAALEAQTVLPRTPQPALDSGPVQMPAAPLESHDAPEASDSAGIHPPSGSESIGDPLEPVNRATHGLNVWITRTVLEPSAQFLIDWASPEFRRGYSNVMANLREPVSAGSALIEGSYASAGETSMRFLLNSTVGVLGYRDVATEMGYRPDPRTVGQALCRRGAPSGPYIVMPVFGPSSIRDTGGWAATAYAQYLVLGLTIVPYRMLDTLARYMDVREQIQVAAGESADAYLRYRSAYTQTMERNCGIGHPDAAQLPR